MKIKLIFWFLLFPAIVSAQFINYSFNKRNPTSSGWGDISQAPLKIRGANDSTYLSFNPLDVNVATYPIMLRVGERAQSTGDSRKLGYFSDWINTHNNPALESQALYGINLYNGDSLNGADGYDASAVQIGVHGIAQARYGVTDSATGLVGVQGFGSAFSHGYLGFLYGGSFNAQGGAGSNAKIGTLIGVRANSYVEGEDSVLQASSFLGMAPTVTGSGRITNAYTAQFEQPAVGTGDNYALMLNDPTVAAGADDITIAFRDSSSTNRLMKYIQRNGAFKIDDDLVLPNKLSIGPDTVGTASHLLIQKTALAQMELRGVGNGADAQLLLLTGDSTGGQANAVIYFSRSLATAPYDWAIARRYSSQYNQLEFINGSNIQFVLYPDSALIAKKLYKYVVTADSELVTKGYTDIKAPIANPIFTGSLQIPNGANPTTDADGEIAYDTDEEALEVYDGAASRLIPTLRTFDALIMLPDSVNAYDSPIPIFTVDTLLAPWGIKIVALSAATDVSTTDTVAFWEFASPSAAGALIDTVIISAGYEAKETTITDSDIAAAGYIYLDLSSGTALDWIKVQGIYWIKDGN